MGWFSVRRVNPRYAFLALCTGRCALEYLTVESSAFRTRSAHALER